MFQCVEAMNEPTYYFFFGASVMWLLHLIVISERQYSVILLAVLGIVVYRGWLYYQSSLTQRHSVHHVVEELVETSQNQDMMDGDLPSDDQYAAAKDLISSDVVLQQVLSKLKRYRAIDVEMYDTAVRSLMKFYDLYAEILAGQKPIEVHLITLMDTRRALLNTIASLYTQLEHSRHAPSIHKIITILQASTWKCLNVLKNKSPSHTLLHVSPVASNLVGHEYDLF